MIALAACGWGDNPCIEGLTGPSSGQTPDYTLMRPQDPCLPLMGSVLRHRGHMVLVAWAWPEHARFE